MTRLCRFWANWETEIMGRRGGRSRARRRLRPGRHHAEARPSDRPRPRSGLPASFHRGALPRAPGSLLRSAPRSAAPPPPAAASRHRHAAATRSLVALPDLQRGARPDPLPAEARRARSASDFAGEAESVEPARRQHNRVEPALSPLAQARVDVLRSGSIASSGSSASSSAPANRRGADPSCRAAAQPSRTARHADPHAGCVRADDQAVDIRRRHVFGGVHGNVDPAGERGPPRAP